MQLTRPKLVFIGRKYHAKTKSDQLVLSILSQAYDVNIIRREEHSDQEIVSIVNKTMPEAVLFWCLPPSFTYHLCKFRVKNIIWAPMWDGFEPLSFKKRLIFSFYKIKILCFSQMLYYYFNNQTSLRCFYSQCFLEPKLRKTEQKRGPYTFFFWQREMAINMDRLVDMIGERNIKKIIYKSEIGVPLNLHYPFEIELLPDWLSSDDYQRKIEEADFFIAPRRAEGIGFSFLEPMSKGIPIIGYNNSTMNEYIKSGVNGYLFGDEFKLDRPLESPFSLSQKMEERANLLYQKWLEQQTKIIPFIKN